MLNSNGSDVTNSVGTDVNSPAATVYSTFYQLPYFTKGEVVIGRDLAAGSQPESGILRSGQKNTGTDIGGSDLTLRAGGGTGSGSLLGKLVFQTPDVTSSGTTIQAYTTKATITRTGNLLIGTTTDVPSSKLTIESTTQGFLPPRMTTAQRNAIASPAAWLTIICTDCTATDGSTGVMQVYNLGLTTWKNAW
jgi:hypothetical protein